MHNATREVLQYWKTGSRTWIKSRKFLELTWHWSWIILCVKVGQISCNGKKFSLAMLWILLQLLLTIIFLFPMLRRHVCVTLESFVWTVVVRRWYFDYRQNIGQNVYELPTFHLSQYLFQLYPAPHVINEERGRASIPPEGEKVPCSRQWPGNIPLGLPFVHKPNS